MKNETFLVYAHTCNINGKKYVGLTSKSLEERSGRNGHGYRQNKEFITDIKKYGWDKFTHKVLEENLTLDEARERERYYIKEFNTQNADFGYNTSAGGDYSPEGIQRSEETKNKISESLKGKRHSEERRRNESEAHKGISPWNKGKQLPEEAKRKQSQLMKGRHKYNNGEITIMAFECPPGFTKGQLKKS